MKRRELLSGLAAAALASGCTSQATRRVQPSQARFGSPVPLPSPATTDTISLEQAIGKRRSLRAFRPDPLPTATIGQLLWAGQGVTSPDGKRAAPSAGALYPLELYVVTPEQVMHYLPDGHRAETRAVSDLRPGLKAAAVGQSSVGTARPSSSWPRFPAASATDMAPRPGRSSRSRSATPPRTSCSRRPPSDLPPVAVLGMPGLLPAAQGGEMLAVSPAFAEP